MTLVLVTELFPAYGMVLRDGLTDINIVEHLWETDPIRCNYMLMFKWGGISHPSPNFNSGLA